MTSSGKRSSSSSSSSRRAAATATAASSDEGAAAARSFDDDFGRVAFRGFEQLKEVKSTPVCAVDPNTAWNETWQFYMCVAICVACFFPVIGALGFVAMIFCSICFFANVFNEAEPLEEAGYYLLFCLVVLPEPPIAVLLLVLYFTSEGELEGRELECFAPMAAFVTVAIFVIVFTGYRNLSYSRAERKRLSTLAFQEGRHQSIVDVRANAEELGLNESEIQPLASQSVDKSMSEAEYEETVIRGLVHAVHAQSNLSAKPTIRIGKFVLAVVVALIQTFLDAIVRIVRRQGDTDTSVFGDTSLAVWVTVLFMYAMFAFTVGFVIVALDAVVDLWSAARAITIFNTASDVEATKFVDSKGAPATLHFVNPGQISIWTKVNDRLIALYLDTGDTRSGIAGTVLVSGLAIVFLTLVMVISLVRTGVQNIDSATDVVEVFSPVFAYAVFDLIVVAGILLGFISAGVKITDETKQKHTKILQTAMFDLLTRRVGEGMSNEARRETTEGLQVALQGVEAREPLKILGVPLTAATRNKVITLAITGITTGAANLFRS